MNTQSLTAPGSIPKKLFYICTLSLGLVIGAPSAQAQGLFQKAVGKMAKVSGKLMGNAAGLTGTTSDLSSVQPLIVYRTNLYPKEAGAMEIDMFGKGWKEGADAVQVQFTKKHGVKMTKLEGGTVTIDGSPADFQDFGVYTYISDHSDGPKKIVFTASNGEKSSFTITPEKAIKLTKINGQSGDNISVDLTKDVTLEFDNPGPADGALIQLSITGSILGLKTFYEIGNFKPAKKIVVPAAAFANTGFPANGNSINFNKTYLQIARTSYEYATECSGTYKKIPYLLGTVDGRFINVDGKPNFTKGIVADGDVNKISYSFKKEEADVSRPFSHAKNIGIVSFAVRGTSFVQKTESNKWAGTETQTTVTFNPGNAFLDAILAKLYPQVVSITESALGAKVLPLEKVYGTEAWKESGFMSETNDGTPTSFARSYKTDKIISEAAIRVDGFATITDGMSISTEAGADALLRCVLDLELKIENGTTYITPKLNYKLFGAPNGISVFPTVYADGIITGRSGKLKDKTTNDDILELISLDDMMTALRTSLTDIKAKEKALGDYDMIWAMQ